MKKLLLMLGAVGLTTTPIISVVSCSKKTSKSDNSKLASIDSLKQQVKNLVNQYIKKNVKNKLTTILYYGEDPNLNEYQFFTKDMLDKIYDRESNKKEDDGFLSHILTTEEKAYFQNDINKIFDRASIKGVLNKLKSMDAYSAYFVGVSEILENINLKQTDGKDKIQLTKVNKNNSTKADNDFAVGQIKFELELKFNYKSQTNNVSELNEEKIVLGQSVYSMYQDSDTQEIVGGLENYLAAMLSGSQKSPIYMKSDDIFKNTPVSKIDSDIDPIIDDINQKIGPYDNYLEKIKEYTKTSFKDKLIGYLNEDDSSPLGQAGKLTGFEIVNDTEDEKSINEVLSYNSLIDHQKANDLNETDSLSQQYFFYNRDDNQQLTLSEATIDFANSKNYSETRNKFSEDEFMNNFINKQIFNDSVDINLQNTILSTLGEVGYVDNLGSYGMIGVKDFNVQLKDLDKPISINATIPYYYLLNPDSELLDGLNETYNHFLILQIGRLEQQIKGLKINLEDQNSILSMSAFHGNRDVGYPNMNEQDWSYWNNPVWSSQSNGDMNLVNNLYTNPDANRAMFLAPKTWGWASNDSPAVVQLFVSGKIDSKGDWRIKPQLEEKNPPGLEKSYEIEKEIITDDAGITLHLFSKDYYNFNFLFQKFANGEMYRKITEALNNGDTFYYIKNDGYHDTSNT